MGSSLNSAETITSFTDTSDKIWLAWAGIDFDEDITISDNGVNTTIQINKDGAADGYLQLVGILIPRLLPLLTSSLVLNSYIYLWLRRFPHDQYSIYSSSRVGAISSSC